MRKFAFALCLLLGPAGCAVHNAGATTVQTERANNDIVVLNVATLGFETFNYVIDRRTQQCYLQNRWSYVDEAGLALAPVSCERVKSGAPEAAQHITWTGAAQTPAPPPSSALPPRPAE